MKTFIGIDYHKRFSYATIMLETGQITKQGRIVNHPQSIEKFLDGHCEGESSAVLEAGYNSEVMYDWLEALVDNVCVAHPTKLKIIAEARIKTDKIDSAHLANFLRCDLIPRAHVSSARGRIGKKLLRYRMFLVHLSTMFKNRVHSVIDGYPLISGDRPFSDIFSKKGLAWLESLDLPKHARRILDSQIFIFRQVREQIKEVDKWVAGFGRGDERVKHVQTVPGIGKSLGLLVVSEIDEIERFRRPNKLCAYAGLVPGTYSSGGKFYTGRITKQGNKFLRWAMVEAVWPAIRHDQYLREYYLKIQKRKGANSAKVATARRLLTVIYRVLKEHRGYRRYNYN